MINKTMFKNKVQKKSIIGPIISVFVMVLVVSILSGLTFLFVSQLKTNVGDTTATASGATYLEAGWINATTYTLDNATVLGARNFVIVEIVNTSSLTLITSGNYTLSGSVLTNTTAAVWPSVSINYTYNFIEERTAYDAINDTEAAGADIVDYLSLIFLAVIFGAILTLVMKIILPYINLGKSFDGF